MLSSIRTLFARKSKPSPDEPRENTHENSADQILYRDCFFSLGFVPDTRTPKGNFNWYKYNRIKLDNDALVFYKQAVERIPRFMLGDYVHTDSESLLHPVALHYFMRNGVFAAVMSADGRWDWVDSTQLQYSAVMQKQYIDFCDKNVPVIFVPLTPTQPQRRELDAAVKEVVADAKADVVVRNRIRTFTVNCAVSYGDYF